MDQKKLLFIFNPNAGRGQVRSHLSAILDIFVKAGYEVTVYSTQAKDDVLNKIPFWAGQYDRIVCCGGDGTLNEVATGMIQSGTHTPIGYIPAGTTNDFAQSLGIPTDLEEAADIAAGGRLFECDMGRFNDDFFIYIAAFGVFTDVSYQTGQKLKSVLGHAAYLVETPKSLMDMTPYHMVIEANGETVEGEFVYGMISNAVSVGGIKNLAGTTVALDDGKFEVTFVYRPQNPVMVRDILTNLLRARDSDSPYIFSCKSDHVVVHCDESVPWTLDGEFGGEHSEVEIRNICREITYVVPEEEPL